MSSDGTKVTTDPEGFRNPIQEGTGFVASDSLAAESLAANGSFDGTNPNAAADRQPARGATANTTDTSAVEQLNPASSRAERDDGDETYQAGGGAGSGGAGRSEGRGSAYDGDAGGYGGARGGDDGGSYGRGDGSSADVAPSYVGLDRDSNAPGRSGGPKGRDLTEGGFDDSAPNASFNSEIGGKNDPGRVAEEGFDKRNADAEYGVGGGVQRQGDDEGNPYSELRDQQA